MSKHYDHLRIKVWVNHSGQAGQTLVADKCYHKVPIEYSGTISLGTGQLTTQPCSCTCGKDGNE